MRRLALRIGGASLSILGAFLLNACGTSSGDGVGTGGTSAAETGGSGPSAGGANPGNGGSAAGGAEASGGAASGGAATAELPAELTLESVTAFLADGSYKSWHHDPEPRAPAAQVIGSPHGGNPIIHSLQTYVNAQAVLSIQTNKDRSTLEKNHDPGSMAVKEVYDDSGNLLTTLAMIKVSAERRAFAYYCDGDPTLCTSTGDTEVPFFSPTETAAQSCSSCHGGSIYFPLDE